MKIIFGILLIALFLSCEESYELDNVEFKEEIVVSSVFTNDAEWSLKLSTTYNVFNPNSKPMPITDAYVLITEANGITQCELIHIGDGEYVSDLCRPNTDTKYRVYVNSPTYGQVNALSSLPLTAAVKINTIDTSAGSLSVDFDITNKSKLSPYFIWDIVEVSTTEIIPDSTTPGGQKILGLNLNKWLRAFTPDINNIKINDQISSFNTPLPALNAGDVVSTSITSTPSNNLGGTVITSYKRYLRVMTVSEDLYKYYKSIENYVSYQEHQSSLSEPFTVYSNIVNGSGIFAGYSIQYIALE